MGRHARRASRRELTRRRWRNFGISGAKLIWGGEAVAVRHDGRANPNQLLMTRGERSRRSPACATTLVAAHRERFGANADGDLFLRPAADALGALRAAERLRSARAARGVPNPVLDRRVCRPACRC